MAKIETLNVDDITVVDGFNVRKNAGKKTNSLFELEESLDKFGQVVPILVNRTADGKLELIGGERRWHAAQAAGVETVEAKVYDAIDAAAALELHLVENIQRVALTPIEEAVGMQRLADCGRSIREVAHFFGVSEDTARRRMDLLKLPAEVQKMIVREKFALPVHQAGMLVGLSTGDALRIARQAAPSTGPVASEREVRQWVEELTKGPDLPCITRSPAKKKTASAKTGTARSEERCASEEIEIPLSADAGKAFQPDGCDVVVSRSRPMPKNENKAFESPFIYRARLPKGTRCTAEVRYATDGKKWYWTPCLSTPKYGQSGPVSTVIGEKLYPPQTTGDEAVVAGLTFLMDELSRLATQQTATAAEKKKLEACASAIGRQIAAILKWQNDRAAQARDGAAVKIADERMMTLVVGALPYSCHRATVDGRLRLRFDWPDKCLFRTVKTTGKTKTFICQAFENGKGPLVCENDDTFPADCPLHKGVTLTSAGGGS